MPQDDLPKTKARGRPKPKLTVHALATGGGDSQLNHLAKFNDSALNGVAMLPNMQAIYGNMGPSEISEAIQAKCRVLGMMCEPPVSVTAQGMWCPKNNIREDLAPDNRPEWNKMNCMKYSPESVKRDGLGMIGGYMYLYFGRGDLKNPIREPAHRFLCYVFLGPPESPDSEYKVSDYDCHHLCMCPTCLCPFHLEWRLKSEHNAIHKKGNLQGVERDPNGRIPQKRPMSSDDDSSSG